MAVKAVDLNHYYWFIGLGLQSLSNLRFHFNTVDFKQGKYDWLGRIGYLHGVALPIVGE